jgi:hypothetical protein
VDASKGGEVDEEVPHDPQSAHCCWEWENDEPLTEHLFSGCSHENKRGGGGREIGRERYCVCDGIVREREERWTRQRGREMESDECLLIDIFSAGCFRQTDRERGCM